MFYNVVRSPFQIWLQLVQKESSKQQITFQIPLYGIFAKEKIISENMFSLMMAK